MGANKMNTNWDLLVENHFKSKKDALCLKNSFLIYLSDSGKNGKGH